MRPPRAAALVALAGLLLLPACGRSDGEGVIDRETFIATYVDLRAAALESPTRTLSAAERDRVLAEHGITRADLLEFADVHAADPGYMVALWTEVSARVNPPAPPPDSTAAADPAGDTLPRPPSAPPSDLPR